MKETSGHAVGYITFSSFNSQSPPKPKKIELMLLQITKGEWNHIHACEMEKSTFIQRTKKNPKVRRTIDNVVINV